MMADWLSKWSIMGVDSDLMISPRKHTSIGPLHSMGGGLYSTLVVESMTRGCFFELLLTSLIDQEAYLRWSVRVL